MALIDTSTMTPAQIEAAAAAFIVSQPVADVIAQIAAFRTAGLLSTSPMAGPIGNVAVTTAALAGAANQVANPLAPTFPQQQAQAVRSVAALFASKVAAGLAYGGHQIALDDGSRANLTALMVAAGSMSTASDWMSKFPDYARGWIATDNTRIPLPDPATAQDLAIKAGNLYAALVQHELDLVTSILGAADAAGLAAVDTSSGWAS